MSSGVSGRVISGEMKGMHKVETAEQMPEEYRATLLKIINAQIRKIGLKAPSARKGRTIH